MALNGDPQPQSPERPLARYYRSRNLANPVLYVQDEGYWRGYTPNGALQKAAGVLPEVILARSAEITQDEAEVLMAAWAEQVRTLQHDQGPPANNVSPGDPGDGATPAADRETPTIYGPPVPPRSRFSRRLVYASAGAAAVIVIALLVALAATGTLWTGAKAATPGEGSGDGTETTAARVSSEDAVAKVGSYTISRQQLDQKVADFEAEYAGQIPDKTAAPDQYKLFEEDVLDYMVTYQVADQRAAALGVTVTDQDVQAEMTSILETSYGGDQTRFEEALAQQGMTMDQFERIYRESLLLNKVYAEVTKGAAVTDREIQTYFDQHTADSYAGKSLADVKDEIQTALLRIERQKLWRDWLSQERKALGVKYANGWAAPANVIAPAP